MIYLPLLFLALVGAAGCSDDSDSGGSAAGAGKAITAERLEQFCAKNTARRKGCDAQASYSEEECKTDFNCFGVYIRAETTESILQCLESRPCDKSDDACFVEVSASYPLPAKGSQYEKSCKTKLAECSANGADPMFSDDWCTGGDVPWGLFPDRIYDLLTPCFSKACGEVNACLKQLDIETLDRSLCTVP